MSEQIPLSSGISADDRLLIQETLVRYATGIDLRQWEQFRNCWTDECRASYGDIVLKGADAVTQAMVKFHRKLTSSQHRVTNIDILTWRDDVATARAYIHAVHYRADPANGGVLHVVGYHDDVLARESGQWKLKDLTWTTTWTDGNVEIMDWGEGGAAKVGAL